MLLRRVIAHVKDQNWFAVGLDFVIVVVGVFVGLQVSNWNASLDETRRAVIYLERMHADLETDLGNYQDSIGFWRQTSDYGLTALDYVDTGEPGDNTYWQVLLAFYQASQVDEFQTTQTTYDEVTSAGEWRLINDNDIRESLASYYSSGDNPTLTLFPQYREHVRGIVPIAVQTYIWENCYSVGTDNQQYLLDCDAPVSDLESARIVNQLSADTALMSELRYWVSNMRVATSVSRARMSAAILVQDEIRAELDR